MSWQSDLFEGRTVLVTGGTSGIGAGAALRFAELGADVLAVGLDAEGSHSPKHHRVRVAELDATDADAIAAFMAGMAALHVLVCCAGISRDRQEYDLEVFTQVLAVNLVATMRAAEAARPRDGGRAARGRRISHCVVVLPAQLSSAPVSFSR